MSLPTILFCILAAFDIIINIIVLIFVMDDNWELIPELFNPIIIYKGHKVNYFGCFMLMIFYHAILAPLPLDIGYICLVNFLSGYVLLGGNKIMIDCFNFRHHYTEQDIVNLNQMHTKQLLKERDRCYSDGCSGNYYTSNSPECKACLANQDYNMTQIKKILATREHVLNKQESKALRKQRIKKGK